MSEPLITPTPTDPAAPSLTQQEFADHLRNYLSIFGSLLVLSLISFAFWYFQVRLVWQIVLTLAVAGAQAFLNLRYLMHLKGESGTIKHFLIMTAVFSFFLMGLSLLAFFNHIPGTHH